jgi:peptidoglycan-associated lipoprotein
MKLSRYLSTVAVALALVSCGGAEETPKEDMNEDVVVDDDGTTIIVELEDAQDGIAPGSQEDYLQRVGEDAMVFFDFDKYNLKPSATSSLKKQAMWLRQFPEIDVKVEGHCDERGTREYNLGLGERRANEVKKYLVAQGIASSRIDTISYGEERPLDPRTNEAAWARNRRGVTTISE